VQRTPKSSWEQAGKWYNDAVGEKGHYYHQTLIIPKVLELFDFHEKDSPSLLDLACGQGILSRSLPPYVQYTGVDAAHSLIAAAKKYTPQSGARFIQGDITEPLKLKPSSFTHAALILALQNLENPLGAFRNASRYLKSGCCFVIVINHPCFRIPRQSSWEIDEGKKIQYRRVDRYMSSMQIPIQTHPGKGKSSSQTLSFHYPLGQISSWLTESGFVIKHIDEWCSDKVSRGKTARMENRARDEIPLFMAIKALKQC
jgi:ubiquinone/menaquinone biosynthesis C-methylase UbiE